MLIFEICGKEITDVLKYNNKLYLVLSFEKELIICYTTKNDNKAQLVITFLFDDCHFFAYVNGSPQDFISGLYVTKSIL